MLFSLRTFIGAPHFQFSILLPICLLKWLQLEWSRSTPNTTGTLWAEELLYLLVQRFGYLQASPEARRWGSLVRLEGGVEWRSVCQGVVARDQLGAAPILV